MSDISLFATSSSESDSVSENSDDSDFIVSDSEPVSALHPEEQLERDREIYLRSLRKPRGRITLDSDEEKDDSTSINLQPQQTSFIS